MTASSPSHPLATIATVTAFVVYFVALHALVVSGALPHVLVLLVVAPWIVAGASWSMSRVAWPAAVRVLVLVAAIGLLVGVAWRLGTTLALHADLVLYLENLVFMAMLAMLFAGSLRGDALVTRLARIARNGDMPPDIVRYTRRVTVTWAAFFTGIALVSTALYFTQSRVVWSSFVNLAIGPLTVALFVGEYAFRRLVLREEPRVPMMAGARAFRTHARDDVRSEGP